MAPWRSAKALEKLRAQINALAPNRSKASDGTIGDAAHAASKSEHNPEDHDHDPATPGVVRAMDITHDPAHGCDAQRIVDSLVASKDPRILYLIFNGRMWRSYDKGSVRAWSPAPYTGSNAHAHHFHISVAAEPRLFDSETAWVLPGGSAPSPTSEEPLRRGDEGERVREAQNRLIAHGFPPVGGADGDFGGKTEDALKRFKVARGLPATGVIDAMTWRALRADKPGTVSPSRPAPQVPPPPPPRRPPPIAQPAKSGLDRFIDWILSLFGLGPKQE